jgi:transcriptional regulator with XRE-family HTH domain
MTQADLSVKANISLSHVSDNELGKSKMMLATFTRVAEALKISADVLLRPDITEVNNLYQYKFAEILGDCIQDEIDTIIKIVKKLNAIIHSNKNMYDV